MSKPKLKVTLDDQNDFIVETVEGPERVWVVPFYFLDYFDGLLPFALESIQEYAASKGLTANRIRNSAPV